MLKKYEEFKLNESDDEVEPSDEKLYIDETHMWVDQAIDAIKPIIEDYGRAIDTSDAGDWDDAFYRFMGLFKERLDKLDPNKWD